MLTLVKDLVWTQISQHIRCLHKHIGPTAQIPDDFYYHGPEELTFKVTNGSVGVIYNYLSKINDHFHMTNYKSAFPGLGRTDDAVRDARRQELLFLLDLCKHIEWPLCDNVVKCQKPNQMQLPDVHILINENNFITFPIQILQVKSLARKTYW